MAGFCGIVVTGMKKDVEGKKKMFFSREKLQEEGWTNLKGGRF